MATGASNLAAAQYDVFSVALVPKSSNIAYGHVVVFTSDANENKMVDIPTAATALLGGRAFAGISCGQGTTNTTYDNNIQIQRHGIAKCLLKASTACTRGDQAAYDPADGGTVVPYTSANQVKIGEFRQSKSSSASTQLVEVLLDAGDVFADRLMGAITTSGVETGLDAETLLDQSVTIKANRLKVGSVVHILGKVRCTTGADTETAVLTVYWGGLTGTALAACTGTNLAANDVYLFDIWATVRSATTADWFGYHTIVPAAVTTAVPVSLRSNGATTIPTTASDAVIGVSCNWSAASDDRVALESLIVIVSNGN